MPDDAPHVPSLSQQIIAASAAAAVQAAEAQRPPWPLNPFPRGLRPGSGTDRVLQELRRVAPRPLEAGQLRMRCQISRGALAWAVRYLQEAGNIRAIPHHKHPQYFRYVAVTKAPHE